MDSKLEVIIAESDDQKSEAWRILDITCPEACINIPNYKEYRNKVMKKAVIMQCCIEGRTVGMVAFYCNDIDSRMAYITQIATLPSYQGLGVGRVLIEKCVEYSIRQGMEYLKLEVADNNEMAIRFYSGLGLQFCGNASSDSKYMIKRIVE